MQPHKFVFDLIIVGLLIYGVSRQLRPRKISRGMLVVLPLVFLYEGYKSAPFGQIAPHEVAECILTLLVGLVAGALQGLTTDIYERNGTVYMKGGWIYLGIWAVFLATRLGIHALFHDAMWLSSSDSSMWISWLGIAATWGTRSLVLLTIRQREVGNVLARPRRT